MRFAIGLITTLIAGSAVVAACSDGDAGRISPSSTTLDGSADAPVVDPTCTEQGSQRESPPQGACATAGASCEFTTPAGVRNCKPGQAFISASPGEFHCDCSAGSWVCNSIGGGFGLTPCPDAGEPDATELDGSSDASDQ